MRAQVFIRSMNINSSGSTFLARFGPNLHCRFCAPKLKMCIVGPAVSKENAYLILLRSHNNVLTNLNISIVEQMLFYHRVYGWSIHRVVYI